MLQVMKNQIFSSLKVFSKIFGSLSEVYRKFSEVLKFFKFSLFFYFLYLKLLKNFLFSGSISLYKYTLKDYDKYGKKTSEKLFIFQK